MKLYYGADVIPTTDVEKAAADALKSAGTKAIRIASSDNLSKAEGTIQVPGYVRDENNMPPAPIAPPISALTNSAAEVNISGAGYIGGFDVNNLGTIWNEV